jgi:hypothetical protein
MRRLPSNQFRFLDATNVQAVQTDNGDIYIQLRGVMKSTKISFANVKVIQSGVAESGEYVPDLEEFANAEAQKNNS